VARALIVFASRIGTTQRIAELIAEGIRSTGAEATAVPAATIKGEADVAGYDAYVFGSATYHGDMMQPMKTFLFLAEKAHLEGKVGGAFGAYGWSGEASVRVFDTMKNVFNMNMVSQPLRLKSAAAGGGAELARQYGREIGEKLKG
jgi:NAD(P)H dehydrogenase (quinone)